MNKPKHSPLPWRLHKHYLAGRGEFFADVMHETGHVALHVDRPSAEFIVAARDLIAKHKPKAGE